MKITKVKTHRYLIICSYILGVVFYDRIQLSTGFSFTDEITAGLLLYLVLSKGKYCDREKRYFKKLVYVFGIFLFYLIYSLHIRSNTRNAILGDLIIQIKPYIAFFCPLVIGLHLDRKGKYIIRKTILYLTPFIIFIGCTYFISSTLGFFSTSHLLSAFGHPSRYATMCQITGLLYLYCSKRTRKDIKIMFFYFALGMLSLRSKCYGFVVFAFMLFFLEHGKLRFSLKHILFLLIALIMILGIAKQRIQKDSATNGTELTARQALYLGAVIIVQDYFPFGSGLASFATIHSIGYYSQTYFDYGLDQVYGLRPSYPYFACDTFYPSLAQFGIIGILLFILFFRSLWKEASSLYSGNSPSNIYVYKACISIVVFFLIENFSDATFTQNRGMFMLMLLAMFFHEEQIKQRGCSID